MDAFENIVLGNEGPIGVITLNRPERRNAIDSRTITELNAALDRLEGDRDVRVILLEGAGKAFCAGFDLGEDFGAEDKDEAEWRALLTRDLKLILRFWDSPKPTIAAVQGFALAGGLEIAMACDITFADRDARFGSPEIRFGSGFVALILPWAAGLKKAKELMFTGEDRVGAREAMDMGIVNRVSEPGRLREDALAMARTIATMDPAKVSLLKRAINATANAMGMRSAIEDALETEIEMECLKTEDSLLFQEILRRDGVKAALAWRDSRFSDDRGA